MSITLKLSKDEKDVKVDEKLYGGMIESLLYLTTSRLDIFLNMVYVFGTKLVQESVI